MMHIAYCFDKNYRAQFGASVTSLLLNRTTRNSEITIHVVTDEVDQAFENSLKKLRCVFNVNITTYVVTPEQQQRFPGASLSSHICVTTYFRLLLPELLPSGIDKLLYIDADTIVLADIAELYARNLEGCTVAGALDYSNMEMSTHLSLSKYINSGVLLFDITRWLHADYTTKCIAFANQYPNKIRYQDQCALNQVLLDDIAVLEPKWNKYITSKSPESDVEGAAILHFISPNKPWQKWYESPVSKYYWRYLDVSPWQGTKPVSPRTVVEARRYAKKLQNEGRLLESIEAFDSLMLFL